MKRHQRELKRYAKADVLLASLLYQARPSARSWWIGFGLICLGNMLSWAVVIWFLWTQVR